MVHGSDLIKSFLRFTIIRKKEEAAKKLILASGAPISKENLAKLNAGTNKAEFLMRQRAKRFREVNSELMMSASQVPLDTLIQNVFNTVDKQLQGMKDSVFTSGEMEDLLSQVEGNQKQIELQLEELKTKNRSLLATFGLQMPTEQAFAAINAQLGAIINDQFAFKGANSPSKKVSKTGQQASEVVSKDDKPGKMDLDEIEKEL